MESKATSHIGEASEFANYISRISQDSDRKERWCNLQIYWVG